ncbi:MAG TPA: DUF87 domain-containing protein [Candidatus Kryptobacter bacterium]|nr:DUF87 domain-containing protein [Candidatus Kryptobacter bacterium]
MRIPNKFLELLTGQERPPITDNSAHKIVSEPKVRYEEIPGTLDLGWTYSENNDEFQMAKVSCSDRATHMYVIGATGSGKTKFLEFLIEQDIKERNGFGILDPHGDLVEDIKGFLANSYDNEGIQGDRHEERDAPRRP